MSQDQLTVDEVLSISDPGEINADQHLWGDRLMVRIANVFAWIFPILMAAIVTQVVIRKLGFNQAWLDELQWWMYGVAMLVGFGYSITTNSHVRVDILHQGYSDAKKAKIEVFALGWLLIPFMVMMTDILCHYAWSSITALEGSDSPNGLHRLYLLKSSLPVLFAAAIIAAVAALYRNLETLVVPKLWTLIIAAFPAIFFATQRFVHYAFWWFTRFTNPDLNPRRITKEPIFDYSLWVALVILIVIVAISISRSRASSAKA